MTSDFFNESLSCAARGWAVFPLIPGKKEPLTNNGFKAATCDPAALMDWWVRRPDANVGIATGAVSGLVVLDIDAKSGGDETLADLEIIHGRLPQTVEVLTGGGGRHIYFRWPGRLIPSSAGKVGLGLDIRGDGGYVVAPPSLHPSGRHYEWEASSDPNDTDLAEIPTWLLQLMVDHSSRNGQASSGAVATPSGLPVSKAALDFVANGAPVGQQRQNAVKAVRSYLGAGYSIDDTAKAIWRGLQTSPCGDPAKPWTYQDARDLVNNLASSPPPPPAPLSKPQPTVKAILTPLDSPLRRTDTGNAEYFAHLYGGMMRYDHSRSRWLRWCTHWWTEDSDAEVRRLAEQAARKLCAQASTIPDADTAKKVFGWGLRSLQRGGLDATISLAQAQRPIADNGNRWDLDPWLLGVNNGVVDLRTGMFRSGQQEDGITKHADTNFDPDAECPLWTEFLDRIMSGNQNLINFLQRGIGYSLTGIVSERVLFILHGQGANGKSTLLDTIRAMLGSYAIRTPTETLMMKNQTSIPNDIARLRGARFVFASETEGGKRLAESLIKDMTGNDVLSARFMRAEFFDFKPEFKIWMGTNHKPEIRGTDNGIWDRLKLIPFAVRIPEKERDRHFSEKLLIELPGILQWAIAGCLEWQQNGLGIPDEVWQATAGYRQEQDTLAGFIGEHCIIKRGVKVGSTALYKAYVTWCEEGNEKPEKQKAISMRLKEHGFQNERSGASGNYEWHGIGLLDHNSSTEPLNDTEPLYRLGLREDITAGVNRENASRPFSGSVKQSEMDIPPPKSTSQGGLDTGKLTKPVDRSKMQEALDAGQTRAQAVDAATIYSTADPFVAAMAVGPDGCYYPDYEDVG